MWTLIRDSLATAGLKARYQRLIHERLLNFTESTGPQSVEEDPGRWLAVGASERGMDDAQRNDARVRARQLVLRNPHARNILRLLEVYVAGPGLSLAHQLAGHVERTPGNDALVQNADRLWTRFVESNDRHYSPREHTRRAWRDGECFIRKFESPAWPPLVRFVDPETIGEPVDGRGTQGILTHPDDVETPVAYFRVFEDGRAAERIAADEMLHTRVGVDSNQKRGVTIFSPVLDTLTCFDKWVDTELTARKLQSSIVLWRKVQGSPQQTAGLADSAAAAGRREPIRPGTILTTNQSTEIQFLHPNTNFGDAVPLGRMLLLNIAAGAGLPEFMLTSDASNANFASTMVAEGPAVKLFQSEQQFFAGEFNRLWRWIMSDAIAMGLLPADFFDRVAPGWTFPQLVNRDRTKERLADVRLVESQVLSRAEVARRDGVDPRTMREELDAEQSAGTS